jgi:hypothetical protein
MSNKSVKTQILYVGEFLNKLIHGNNTDQFDLIYSHKKLKFELIIKLNKFLKPLKKNLIFKIKVLYPIYDLNVSKNLKKDIKK